MNAISRDFRQSFSREPHAYMFKHFKGFRCKCVQGSIYLWFVIVLRQGRQTSTDLFTTKVCQIQISFFSEIKFRNSSSSLFSQVTYPEYPDPSKTFDRGFCPGLVILHLRMVWSFETLKLMRFECHFWSTLANESEISWGNSICFNSTSYVGNLVSS